MTKTEAEQFIGRTVGGWRLTQLLGIGRSAAVFAGARGPETAAVKVFDQSLVEEFGKEAQLNRIQRELSLRGQSHPNLVNILDGGECSHTGHLYVVMDLVSAPNLASVITRVPRDRIRPLISQVANAARYLLETLDIVHRDIKPDNIAVDAEFSHATLLDLGVIRPLDVSKLAASSSGDRQNFLGTLRYSPPEYLFRTEKQDKEGYRAITFYQLGGVLHDLIIRERLFLAFSSPYARLVKAVEQEIPKIQQSDVPQDLIWLAKNCLLKNPEHRLRFVKWEDFDQPSGAEPVRAARERVMRRFASSLEASMPAEPKRTAWDTERAVANVQQRVTTVLKDICSAEKMFPRSVTRELPFFSEPPSANVLLVFEAAPSLQIENTLAVLVTADIIDIEPESVQLSLRAVIGYEDSLEGQQELRSAKGLSVFQGVLDEGIMAIALENALFQAVDSAQAAGKGAGKVYLEV